MKLLLKEEKDKYRKIVKEEFMIELLRKIDMEIDIYKWIIIDREIL